MLQENLISTTLECEGLGTGNGRELIGADTPEQFTAAIQKLLENPELSKKYTKCCK